MFFPLARLRAAMFFSLLFTSCAVSREQSLFTSSVTYCEPPETLLIQQFDVAYVAKNQSISFNISAASVQANVNVTANLLLNVYGIRAINVTLDLCNILGGALCPLPMYNFTGSDSISLPESLGVQDRIPGIAFKIPDLEGVAQLVLTEVGTGVVKACVQATLSNGWSTHQAPVEWVTGGVALATLLLSIWHSFSPGALLPFRLIDLLLLYQTIASSSFLSLNYPSTYRAFTLNFAWAMGLFSTSPSSSLQSSIDQMRHLTGGKLPNSTSASAVGLVNRKLSPYNFLGGGDTRVPLPLNRRTVNNFDLLARSNSTRTKLFSVLALHSATQGGDVQTVTTSSSNVLQAGLPIFVNSLHIATANAFMTVFLCALILIASALGVFVVGFALVYLLGRSDKDREHRLKSLYLSFVHAWTVRLTLFLFSPIVIFSFYQWTLKDSWLSVLLSVVAFLVLLSTVSYPTFFVVRYALREGSDVLYKNARQLASYGALYAQYQIPRFYFFLPLLGASFLKAIIIAFVKDNGEAQVILMVVLEGFTVLAHLLLRPSKTRGGDVFSTFLAITRLVCIGLMISFVERLNVAPIPRVVIGLVIAVLFSIAIIVTYVNLVIHFGIARLCTCRSARSPDHSGSNASIMEKGEQTPVTKSSSSEHIGRPNNPTPDSSDPLAPDFLHPFPVSPTETENTSAYISSRTSGTMTVGSILPRRWSFSPLNSPNGSSQIHEPSSYNSHSSHVLSRYSDTPSSPHHGQERT